MPEWGVFGVISALVGFLVATAGPLLKLNGAITRLTVAVEGFQKSLDKLDSENRNSHKDIYKRLDGHDTALAEHGQRIKHLEEEEQK